MIITGGLRLIQLLFGIVVLGLSISLIKSHLQPFSPPAQIDYAAFCGGFCMFVALVGLGALFLEPIQGLIMAGLDGLASVLMLVGGIIYAATLGVNSCSDEFYIKDNVIVRGGPNYDGQNYWNPDANLTARCQQAKATTAFLFFALAALLATTILGVMGRSGGKGNSIV